MIEFDDDDLVLAIESAIAGGSIGLYSRGKTIAEWAGDREVSRAEDLLPNIAAILARNDIDRSHVRGIAVSAGPGSFTGIRIGIATALGLKAALNIPCVGVSALEAIAIGGRSNRVAAVLPMGRGAFCFQGFELVTGCVETLFDAVAARSVPKETLLAHGIAEIVVHHSIVDQITSALPGLVITDAGIELSHRIAAATMVPSLRRSLQPIFLSLAANA